MKWFEVLRRPQAGLDPLEIRRQIGADTARLGAVLSEMRDARRQVESARDQFLSEVEPCLEALRPSRPSSPGTGTPRRRRWPCAARRGQRLSILDRFVFMARLHIPASRCLIATTPVMGFPAGTVRYALRDSSTVCEILTSYVEPWARRCGVRTALHRALIEGYPTVKTIVTDSALGKASRKWMRRQGYKKSAAGWRLEVKRKER